jgi:hypothetical protein
MPLRLSQSNRHGNGERRYRKGLEHIENPEVVNKSFAVFWQSAGIDPS